MKNEERSPEGAGLEGEGDKGVRNKTKPERECAAGCAAGVLRPSSAFAKEPLPQGVRRVGGVVTQRIANPKTSHCFSIKICAASPRNVDRTYRECVAAIPGGNS